MWGGALLLLVLAAIPLSEAFYIYRPPYRTDLVDSLPPSTDIRSRDVPSLKLVRRPVRRDPAPAPSKASLARSCDQSPIWSAKSAKRSTNVIPAPPATLPNSAGVGQDGTDYSYFVEARFGSNGKRVYLLIDTGASSTWVMGSDCTSTPCQTHRTFGPADSTTYQTEAGSFSNFYGTGNVSGGIASDDVEVAGFKFPMTFGVANETSDDFNYFPMDGILGLSLRFGSQPTFLQALVASRRLKNNLFAVHLVRAADGVSNGEIVFGEPNPAMYTGSFKYTNLAGSANGNWAIALDDVGFDGKTAGVSGRNAYIDTGTSYIFGPKEDVAKFHALVPGAVSADGETFAVPCSTTQTASFTFSGQAYTVSSQDWVGPEVNGTCTSNIFGKALVPNAWLLGDTFLKNVYSLFDIDNTRIGFATNSPTSVTPTNSSSTSSPVSSSKSSSSPIASKEKEGGASEMLPRCSVSLLAFLAAVCLVLHLA